MSSINSMSRLSPAIADFMQALESHGVASTNVAVAGVILDAYETASGGSTNSDPTTTDPLGSGVGVSTAYADLENILTTDTGGSTHLANDLQKWLQSDLGMTSTNAAIAAPVVAALAPLLQAVLGGAGSSGSDAVSGAGGGNNQVSASTTVNPPQGTTVSTTTTVNDQTVNSGGQSGGTGGTSSNVVSDLQSIVANDTPGSASMTSDITSWLENDLGLSPSEATLLAPLISAIAPALAGALGGSSATAAGTSMPSDTGSTSMPSDTGSTSMPSDGGVGGTSTNVVGDLQSIVSNDVPGSSTMTADVNSWLQNDLGLSPSEASMLAPLVAMVAPALVGALGGSSATAGGTSMPSTSQNPVTADTTVNAPSNTSVTTTTTVNGQPVNGATSTYTFTPTGDAIGDFESFATNDAGNVSSLTQDATTWAENDLQLAPSVASAIAPMIAAIAPALAALGTSSSSSS